MTETIQPFDFSVNLLQAILWQYNNAPNIQGILQQKQDWYDVNQTEFWNDWYRDVFNLQTANEFGLNIWSIILGQPIYVTQSFVPITPNAWGFGSSRKNFTRGNFRSTSGATFPLSLPTARVVLQLRYFQLIGTCTVPSINRCLAWVFKNYGLAYVIDGLNMTQTYHFGFVVSPELAYVFDTFDILPRPTGVKNIRATGSTRKTWGFGVNHYNFNRGNFGS